MTMLSEYRVLVKRVGLNNFQYQVHEVFFNENKKPVGYSSPSQIISNSEPDLAQKLDIIKEATQKPLLWYGKNFPQEFKNDQA